MEKKRTPILIWPQGINSIYIYKFFQFLLKFSFEFVTHKVDEYPFLY